MNHDFLTLCECIGRKWRPLDWITSVTRFYEVGRRASDSTSILTRFAELKVTCEIWIPSKVGLGRAHACSSRFYSLESSRASRYRQRRHLHHVVLFSEDERLDGSGSECNSVVPKKRRRRDHGTDHHHHHHHHQQVTAYDEYPASPRSSRSTASSRSSSLLQFESLERTCATLSPSSYSFDSLEYSNRSNTSHPENDSPDSLEQDYDRLLPNGFVSTLADHFPRIRPYRSFESLNTCQKDEGFGQASMSNGFAPLYLKRGADLSNIRKSNQRSR